MYGDQLLIEFSCPARVFLAPEATIAESHNEFAWHDLSTQTLSNPAGDLLEGCDPGGHARNQIA